MTNNTTKLKTSAGREASECSDLLSGVLDIPMEYLSVDVYGHGEKLMDEWPRYYSGHPVVSGILRDTKYIVPPQWIKAR